MKILIFSGSHPRHLFVHNALIKKFDICGVVSMRREALILEPPIDIDPHDKQLFVRHFAERFAIEDRTYGNVTPEEAFAGLNTRFCSAADLNTFETANFIEKCKPDIVFIFGVDLIKDPVFSVLPADKVNMHLGLSPWYRGAATLFWPFYNLEPQFAGTTFHQIVAEADAGAVIHQCVPSLKRGDGIHDVGCRAVVQAQAHAVQLLQARLRDGFFVQHRQSTTGRLYLNSQFRASHLRVIYDLFNNNVVDHYLSGHLSWRTPKLVESSQLLPAAIL